MTIEQLFTKENIALYGVIALFLWRVIDFFLRLRKKKESEIQKLAFDMAKYRCGDNIDPFSRESIYPYYAFYLDVLENGMSLYDSKKVKDMVSFDKDLSEKVNTLNILRQNIEQLTMKLNEHKELSVNDMWLRNLTWSMWFQETKMLLKRVLSLKKKYNTFK